MQIRSTKVLYFEKYFENTILFCIFKILLGVFCTSLIVVFYGAFLSLPVMLLLHAAV